MSQRLRILGASAIVACSVIFAFAAMEISLRAWRRPLDERHEQLSKKVGDHHRPGARYWYRGEEFETFVEINSLGLRDREISYEKPEGVQRILVVGDSFTDGLQVALDQTFVKVMEQELGTRVSGSRIEVLNAGHVGDGTGRSLLRYRHDGFRYEPDLVVLALYSGNDIRNNHPDLERAHRLAKYGREEAALPGPYFDLSPEQELQLIGHPHRPARERPVANADWDVRIRSALAARFYTYRLLAESARLMLGWGRKPRSFLPDQSLAKNPPKARRIPNWSHLALYRPVYPAELQKAWLITELLLKSFRDEVRARGSRFAVAVIPPRNEVEDSYWEKALESYPRIREWNRDKPSLRLEALLSRLGIAHILLKRQLRREFETNSKPLYFPVDGHFNIRGYNLTGNILSEWVEEEGLLRRGASSNTTRNSEVDQGLSVYR